jgi:hypothetical protein
VALKTKVASLIHNDQYEEALKFLKDRPEFEFEVAYCHLKLNELKKALDVITKNNSKKLPSLHLLAQIVVHCSYFSIIRRENTGNV